MSGETSGEKKRQQAGWWVPALILFILSLIGIRYISSQGWWENTFGSSQRDYQTINTGLSVQAPNQSEVSTDIQNPLNPGRPAQPPTSTESNSTSRDSDRRRALW